MTTSITVSWNDVEANAWAKCAQRAGMLPLQQSFAYGEVARASGNQLYRAVVQQDDNVVAIAQIVVTTRLFYRFAFWLYAPLFCLHLPPATKLAVYQQLRATFPLRRVTHIITDHHGAAQNDAPHLPHIQAEDNTLALFTELNMRRVLTGDHHVWWELNRPLEEIETGLDPKWQQSLQKAQQVNMQIRIGGNQTVHYDWLLAAESIQQQQRGYRQLPAGFVTMFAEFATQRQPILVLWAEQNQQKIAGVLLLLHGPSATYHLSWNTPEGRVQNATNRLLWEAIPQLQKRGVHWLDLGTIDAAHTGLAHFKLGSGGVVLSHAGTFMPWLFGLRPPATIGPVLAEPTTQPAG